MKSYNFRLVSLKIMILTINTFQLDMGFVYLNWFFSRCGACIHDKIGMFGVGQYCKLIVPNMELDTYWE